ncbi:MAG: hypothetical protein KGJ06_08730 [Pseudomonadota bacterium]|nr:hypothetical protein [Pseudomonadota bacterium]
MADEADDDLSTPKERTGRLMNIAQRMAEGTDNRTKRLYTLAMLRLRRDEFEVSGLSDEAIEASIRDEANRLKQKEMGG